MAFPKSARRSIAVLAVAIVAIAAVAAFQLASNSGVLGGNTTQSFGTLDGNVSIGPCCPVERVGYSCCPANIYSSRSIVLTGVFGAATFAPLTSNGGFSAYVPYGSYSVTLTNCTYVGCSRVFPTTVVIYAGRTTALNVSIDTGIR
ncbi:MAG: hypothetical protein KGH57_02580 [Candidatus Micrarchaeota archaeon]|nr:hypothetical protein [Candidatus Micrarchaeota archaeon]